MRDSISNTRTELMHPLLRAELAQIGNEIDAVLMACTVRWAYTLRTFAEQAELYAQGRTKLYDANHKGLGIVTNSKAGQSYHNYGLAVDIVLLHNNGATWDMVKDFDGDGVSDWMECVKIFKAHGWTWGGDFKSIKDMPHFEKTMGHNWRDLLALHEAGKVDKEGYVII